MATRASRRAESLAREVEAVAPRPPDPEELRREDEAFFDSWARDIVRAAHEARARRARGEADPQPVEQWPGLRIMGEAVSFGGFAPPESIRRVLRRLTHAEPDGYIDAETAAEFNEASLEALRRAFALFREEERRA